MAEPTSTAPLVVLVTGLQGTGKSTVAQSAGSALGAPVLAHDWAMSGLRPFPSLQVALEAMTPPGHGVVGWSILCALARAQLRQGSSVVLDGMARVPDIRRCRAMATDEGARLVVILTECGDETIHRSRIEGRQRRIPDWYELDWDHVRRSRARWEDPPHVDLTVQATDDRAANVMRLTTFLGGVSASRDS